MEALLWFIAVQGILGALDMIYHHELTERLPWRKNAQHEMLLHGVRNFFYGVIFLILAWTEFHGLLAWLLAAVLILEVLITLIDFVEEDRTRLLPATERVTHTILAINYGAILALFLPHLLDWANQPTGIVMVSHGLVSWVLTFYVPPVLLWAYRDVSANCRLRRMTAMPVPKLTTLNAPHQRILVTGGTGFLGKPLCQSLIDQGHHLTILTRNMAKAAQPFSGRFSLIDSIERLSPQDAFDSVIDLAGEPVAQRWSRKAREEIINSRIRKAQQLQQFFEQSPHKPEVYINASAIGIYGISEDKVFDESNALSPTPLTFPEEVCIAREKAVEWTQAQRIRLCNLRIGLVLETDGGVLGKMLFPFEFGLGGTIGSGKQWMSWIHRHDLLELIIHCINHPEINGAINGTAPNPVRQKEFAKALGRALHRPAIAPMPAFVVKRLFGEMGEILLLSGQKVLPQKALNAGFRFTYQHIDEALKASVAGKK